MPPCLASVGDFYGLTYWLPLYSRMNVHTTRTESVAHRIGGS